MKLISVVMPSYNRAELVGKAIDSVLTQQVNADIELLIGDNCSTENMKPIYEQYIQKYPGKITVFYRERNVGIASNWAQLILACKGEYVCNCDNDDFWHNPNKLQIQLDYMESHPDSNVLFSQYTIYNQRTGDVSNSGISYNKNIPLYKTLWGSKAPFHISSMMFRREFVVGHVPLEDFIKYEFSVQDWPFYILLSRYTNFDLIDDNLSTFVIHGSSFTNPPDYDVYSSRLSKDYEVVKYLCEKFPDWYDMETVEDWEKYTNRLLLNLAYRKNDYTKAHQYAKKSYHESMKEKCAMSWITFKMYVLLSGIKRKIFN